MRSLLNVLKTFILIFWVFVKLTFVGSRVNYGVLSFIKILINRFLLNLNFWEILSVSRAMIECYVNNISWSVLDMATSLLVQL